MRLAGKTIVITGAGHGIGKAYANRLAREGASLVLFDIDGPAVEKVGQALEAEGTQVIARGADVRDFDALRQLAADTKSRFGRVDGLINNAGILNVVPISRVLFEEIPDEEWDAVLDTNLKGMWLACKAWVPLMRQSGGGSIVNVSSSTIFLGSTTRIHYVASKAAVLGFTRTLAHELGADKIRVNTLVPGSTLSEENPTPEIIAMREEIVSIRAIKRLEYPEDLTGTAVFLMSDDSAFMTAQTVAVEGGMIFTG